MKGSLYFILRNTRESYKVSYNLKKPKPISSLEKVAARYNSGVNIFKLPLLK